MVLCICPPMSDLRPRPPTETLLSTPVHTTIQPRRRDRRLPLLIGGYAVLVALTNIGSIIAPTLVRHQPGLLLALSSRMRHLLFAVPAGINPFAYALIPLARLGSAAALCFTLGYLYGDHGMGWLERQLGDDKPATLRWIEKGVDRAGWLIVFLMPASNVVCALAGYRRIRPARFAAALVSGIVFRLVWIWIAAKQFESELVRALDWIERYQWPLVGAFFALTFIQSFRRAARQVSATEDEELDEVEAEIAAVRDSSEFPVEAPHPD